MRISSLFYKVSVAVGQSQSWDVQNAPNGCLTIETKTTVKLLLSSLVVSQRLDFSIILYMILVDELRRTGTLNFGMESCTIFIEHQRKTREEQSGLVDADYASMRRILSCWLCLHNLEVISWRWNESIMIIDDVCSRASRVLCYPS
jgi:hypothetical protein